MLSPEPDFAWIKKNVSVLHVAESLGLTIRRNNIRCWRPENHSHGDINPSVHLYEKGNRARCFVCDVKGGHSCIDLVMGYLSINFNDAVHWIAARFIVPDIKLGRPLGRRACGPSPDRAGTRGSQLEVLVKSGLFGQLSSAESRILLILEIFSDPDSNTITMSYQAIMRYSGVHSRSNVSHALARLQRFHAIQISRGQRIGITRQCSTYRVTLEDPQFYDLCNKIGKSVREQVIQEREYRLALRAEREKCDPARNKKGSIRRVLVRAGDTATIYQNHTLNMTKAGGLRPPDPRRALLPISQTKQRITPLPVKV